MIRSMSTAVTGLRGHQQKLDVIGNNIANVNTIGFKMSQARFEDLLSQTIQGATGPDQRGGINPSQIGLGMRISSITDIHSQGAITTTDRDTDLAIEGAGYFVVGDGTGAEYYTRAGSFGLDSNGNLVNDNGLFVLGGEGLDPINIPLGDEMIARATTNMRFAGNLDSRQNPTYSFSLGNPTAGDFDITVDINGNDETFNFNYDASAQDIVDGLEVEEINGVTIESVSVTGLGTQANPFIITINETDDENAEVRITEMDDTNLTNGEITWNPAGHIYEYYAYDSQGNRYTIDYNFTKSGVNQWDYSVNVFGEDGTVIPIDGGETGTLVFDTAGALDEDETNIEPLEFSPAGVDPLVIDLNFDNVSQLSGSNNLVVREQDGYGAGELAGFYIDRTGVVVGTYTNGLIDNLGQIQTATFSNPEGLAKIGGNLFQETQNSGDAVVGNPGAAGRGLITASALEMSNTDLSFEFTELITTSRAFQANTRVVTTSDEVLVEVVNMKR